MASTPVDEVVIGDGPHSHSVEIRKLDDGTYEVIGRLYLEPDEGAAGHHQPLRDIRGFPTEADARVWARALEGLMRSAGPLS